MKSGVLRENPGINFSIGYFIRRFNTAMEHEMSNKASEDVHQRWEFMYFWLEKCTGENHDPNKAIGQVEIHDFVKTPEKVGL